MTTTKKPIKVHKASKNNPIDNVICMHCSGVFDVFNVSDKINILGIDKALCPYCFLYTDI